jgi:hypothetical protein
MWNRNQVWEFLTVFFYAAFRKRRVVSCTKRPVVWSSQLDCSAQHCLEPLQKIHVDCSAPIVRFARTADQSFVAHISTKIQREYEPVSSVLHTSPSVSSAPEE